MQAQKGTWKKLNGVHPFSMQTTISNLKFDENGRKAVENTVGKGKIANYEEFLLFLVF